MLTSSSLRWSVKLALVIQPLGVGAVLLRISIYIEDYHEVVLSKINI